MQKNLICHQAGNWWNECFGALNFTSIWECWWTRNEVKNRGKLGKSVTLCFFRWIEGVVFALSWHTYLYAILKQHSVKLFLNFLVNLTKEREVWISGLSCTLLAVLFMVKCLLLSREKMGRGNSEAEHSQDNLLIYTTVISNVWGDV